jgi:hypothetical protein
MIISSLWAMATAALFPPRRAAIELYLSLNTQSWFRIAAKAHSINTVLTYLFPFRNLVIFFLPALSLLLGTNPSHEQRCAAVRNYHINTNVG